MSSESEDNWEEIDYSSSSEESAVSETDKTELKTEQNQKRWDLTEIIPHLEHISTDPEKSVFVDDDDFPRFENEEKAVNFLNKMAENGLLDLNSEATRKRIFEIADFGYKQIGHDTNRTIVVEFDSLFLNLVQHPLVENFKAQNQQFLPLVFAFEKFVSQLRSGHRRLEIHVFRSAEKLYRSPVKKLARRILIDNFKKQKLIKLKEFENWHSDSWRDNLALVDPAFVCISGCSLDAADAKLLHFIRGFALILFGKKVQCVRTEELFFFSNALYGFVFEIFSGVQQFLSVRTDSIQILPKPAKNGVVSNKNENDKIFDKNGVASNKNENDQIFKVLEETRRTLKNDKSFVPVAFGINMLLSKKDATEKLRENCQMFATATIIKNNLSLKTRAVISKQIKCDFDWTEADSDFLNQICSAIFDSFEIFDSEEKSRMCDIVDSRFFFKMKSLLSENFVNSDLDKMGSLWRDQKAVLASFAKSLQNSNFRSKFGENSRSSVFSLQKIDGDASETLCSEINDFLNENNLVFDDPDNAGNNEKLEKELFICDELESEIKDAEMNKKWETDQEKIRLEGINRIKFYAFMKKYSESLVQPKIVLRDVVVEDLGESKSEEKEGKGTKTKKKGKKGKTKNNRTEQIIAKNKLKQTQKAKDDLITFIEHALKPLALDTKIERLDEKLLPLKNPVIALPGQIQVF
ncbi:hypothetical protein MHBO_000482 [Bonamia ostreae]|uniref:ATP-dependent RNA helicase DDX60 PIN-like domain-containing protein n=1 Tax=Bonamia ostreae TaxID=126728 RepID=A0ABV2AGB8_9EUKA